MGYNMYGRIRDLEKHIRYLKSGVEKIDALPRRRRRRNFDFMIGKTDPDFFNI